jgi:hypothetical protein
MKALVFVVLLAVMQAAPPVPRNAAHHNAANGQNVTQDSNDSVTSKADENKSENVPDQNSDKPIAISTLPPVSVTSGWRENLSLFFSGLLIVIGGGGVWAAIRTLRAIESQAKAQMESLRARITFEVIENTYASILQDGHVVVKMQFVNTGGTPAYKVNPEIWIEFRPMHFEDFTENAVHRIGDPVSVYPQSPTQYAIPLGRKASYDEIAGLRRAKTTLAVRIRLTYETLGKVHIVDRAFYVTPDGLEMHSKYNEAN